MTTTALTAMQQGLQSCETCRLLSRPAPGEQEGRCPRCDEELVFRKPDSLQRTWAFLIGAAVCYVPANLLPVLTTTTAAGADSDTIMQGVVLLWSPTGWPHVVTDRFEGNFVHPGRRHRFRDPCDRSRLTGGRGGHGLRPVRQPSRGLQDWVWMLRPLAVSDTSNRRSS